MVIALYDSYTVSMDTVIDAQATVTEDRRHRLRALDGCLALLEWEQLKGRTRVAEDVARVIAERLPSVTPGMNVVDAIEATFLAQEALMLTEPDEAPTPRRMIRPSQRRMAAAREFSLTV